MRILFRPDISMLKTILQKISKTLQTTVGLEQESYLVIAFYALHLWVGTNRGYLVLLVLFIACLYTQTRSLRNTLWISLVATIPFQQAKYFVEIFESSTYPGVTTPIYYSLSYVDLLLLFTIYVTLRARLRLNTVRIQVVDMLLIPIAIMAAISTWTSHFPSIAAFGFLQLIKLFLFYLLSRVLLQQKKLIKLTLEAMLLFVVFNSLLISMQKFHGGPLGLAAENLNTWSIFGRYAGETSSYYRPAGITDDPNASATILGMFIPLLVVLAYTNAVLPSGLLWGALFSACVALIFTGSRAVWGTTAISSLMALFAVRRLFPLRVPRIIRKYGLLVGALTIFACAPFILIRILALNTALSDFGSATYRLHHFQIAFNTMKMYPFGTGLNTTPYEMSNTYPPIFYMYDPSELHNIFAQVLASLGIFGFLSYVLFIYAVVSGRLKRVNQTRASILTLAIVSLLISYLAAGNFYPWLLSIPISGYFWVLAGLYDK